MRVVHCVPLAGFCLSLYSLHVLNWDVNIIQIQKRFGFLWLCTQDSRLVRSEKYIFWPEWEFTTVPVKVIFSVRQHFCLLDALRFQAKHFCQCRICNMQLWIPVRWPGYFLVLRFKPTWLVCTCWLNLILQCRSIVIDVIQPDMNSIASIASITLPHISRKVKP